MEIEKTVKDLMKNCGVSKVEYEGVQIVVYLKDIKPFYEDQNIIKRLASSLKKKISVRVDPNYLMPEDKAKKEIKRIVDANAGITDIYFSRATSEVYIIAKKPGLVIGKHGVNLKEILVRTGWTANILREPTMPSKTVSSLRKSLFSDQDFRKKFLINVGKRINRDSKPVEYVRVLTLGAFKEVGRSSFVIETNNSRVLVDCGINPASLEPSKAYPYLNKMGFALEDLDAVVISHGHMDHVGFLPYLFAYGYDGPVYMTPPTKDLMALLQPDYLNIVKAHEQKAPYNKKAIQEELRHVITIGYGDVVDITPDIKLTFYNAGHIIGSAISHFHIGGGLYNIVYTGDIKFGPTKLFEPAHVNFPRAEALFIESTYGNKNDVLPNRRDSDKLLMETIMKTIKRKGKVLIPVFAVGRSQEIMLVIEEYARNNPDFNVPVYIDGMVLEASAIHTAYPEYLKKSVTNKILQGESPFEADFIKPANSKNREDILSEGPAIILSPSGMLTGGPSVEYLKLLADDPKNTLIFVGYQSQGSLGRKIQQGEKVIPILGDDGRTKSLEIAMEVETVEGFSGHSDIRQLLAFVRSIKPTPTRIFTMHGEQSKTEEFARSISRITGRRAISPYNLEAIRFV